MQWSVITSGHLDGMFSAYIWISLAADIAIALDTSTQIQTLPFHFHTFLMLEWNAAVITSALEIKAICFIYVSIQE